MPLFAHNALKRHLQSLLEQDSRQSNPVVQSLSLFFWQHLEQWLYQLAQQEQPFIISLAGASGSGKSFIREALVEALSQQANVASFTQDNYYRDFKADFPHLPLHLFYDQIDFDDPNHIRFRHLSTDLNAYRASTPDSHILIPRLKFGTPTHKPTILESSVALPVCPFMITEGIHAFYDPSLLPLYDFKIYVDVDEKTRRERWVRRNLQENRGITDNMWQTTVHCLERHILPARNKADLVINNTAPPEQVKLFLTHMAKLLCRPLTQTYKRTA